MGSLSSVHQSSDSKLQMFQFAYRVVKWVFQIEDRSMKSFHDLQTLQHCKRVVPSSSDEVGQLKLQDHSTRYVDQDLQNSNRHCSNNTIADHCSSALLCSSLQYPTCTCQSTSNCKLVVDNWWSTQHIPCDGCFFLWFHLHIPLLISYQHLSEMT